LSNESLRDILRECLFVPDTKPVQEMLEEFQRNKIDIAIVVDEYGSVEGLVTLEDILEEIVGEIQDEFDAREEMVIKLDNGYILDARLPLSQAAELLGIEVPDELDVDTIGGYVLHLFGRIPDKGDWVESGGWKFIVEDVEAKRKRILKIKAVRSHEVHRDA